MKDRKELVVQRFPKYMRTSYFGDAFKNLIDRLSFSKQKYIYASIYTIKTRLLDVCVFVCVFVAEFVQN